MTIHHPIKPAWICGGCAGEWPCQTRRRKLRAEYDHAPVSLALYLAAQLVDAAQDLAPPFPPATCTADSAACGAPLHGAQSVTVATR